MEDYNLIILTGLSGSGKSTALSALEDLGYFCVENLPAALVMPFALEVVAKYKARGGELTPKYALLVDSRDESSFPYIEEAKTFLIKEKLRLGLLYIDCTDEVIVRRFRETRRKHPLLKIGSPYKSISEAVQREHILLKEFRSHATRIIDTSQSSVHELRKLIEDFCNERRTLLVTIKSFGFKYGNPTDIDLLFDVRFLPNPYFEEELKEQTGLSLQVRDFVARDPDTVQFMEKLENMLSFLIPRYEKEGKQYLSIGIGCTGGKHRSVVISEEICSRLKVEGREVQVSHRDIERRY